MKYIYYYCIQGTHMKKIFILSMLIGPFACSNCESKFAALTQLDSTNPAELVSHKSLRKSINDLSNNENSTELVTSFKQLNTSLFRYEQLLNAPDTISQLYSSKKRLNSALLSYALILTSGSLLGGLGYKYDMFRWKKLGKKFNSYRWMPYVLSGITTSFLLWLLRAQLQKHNRLFVGKKFKTLFSTSPCDQMAIYLRNQSLKGTELESKHLRPEGIAKIEKNLINKNNKMEQQIKNNIESIKQLLQNSKQIKPTQDILNGLQTRINNIETLTPFQNTEWWGNVKRVSSEGTQLVDREK